MNNFIIAEYNPFHNGHKYQLENITGTKTVILSGSFTQRGELTILDKYKRAAIALKNGADLILEIPTIYSLQSANNFALGPIQIMNQCNVFDSLVFGAENELKSLEDALKIIESDEFLELEKIYFKRNYSHQTAHQMAFKKLGGNSKIFKSNNILALEYLKALKKTNSQTQAQLVLRKGEDFRSIESKKEFMSATGIREKVYTFKSKDIEPYVPEETYLALKEIPKSRDLYSLLQYNLAVLEKPMKDITGFEEGMEGLFLNHIYENRSNFFKNIVSKRYRLPRIKRLILNYLLNITKKIVDDTIETPPNFIKVLGFNNTGQKILSEIKNNSNVTVITNHRQIKELEKQDLEIYNIDLKASFLAFKEIKDHTELIIKK